MHSAPGELSDPNEKRIVFWLLQQPAQHADVVRPKQTSEQQRKSVRGGSNERRVRRWADGSDGKRQVAMIQNRRKRSLEGEQRHASTILDNPPNSNELNTSDGRPLAKPRQTLCPRQSRSRRAPTLDIDLGYMCMDDEEAT